jgi:hypothetical protein
VAGVRGRQGVNAAGRAGRWLVVVGIADGAPSWHPAHASSRARTSPGRSEIRSAGTRMRARADLTYEASGRWTVARSTTQIIMVTS